MPTCLFSRLGLIGRSSDCTASPLPREPKILSTILEDRGRTNGDVETGVWGLFAEVVEVQAEYELCFAV